MPEDHTGTGTTDAPAAAPPPPAERAPGRRSAVEKGVSTRVNALRKRLESDQLTSDDRVFLDRTRAVRSRRAKGETFEEIAEALGLNPRSLYEFSRAGTYEMFCEYLDKLEDGADIKTAESRVREARIKIASLTPQVARLYEEALARDKKGVLVDPARAMWAAERVGRSSGLDVATSSAKPVVIINIETAKGMNASIRADDAARRAVVDLKPADFKSLPAPE